MKLNKDQQNIQTLFSSELGKEVINYLLQTEVLCDSSDCEPVKIARNEGRRSLVLDFLSTSNLKPKV